MANWLGSRFHERWRYMRVSWDTWEEVEEYDQVISGNEEESYFTSVKESGKAEFEGKSLSQTDLVRTYYEFTDEDGESVSVVTSTMLVEYSKETIREDGAASGSVSLYGVLKVADDRLCGLPYTVSAGVNAVNSARDILNALGLRTSVTASSYTLANDHTFDADDSYLTVVNWLLSAAGYGSAYADPMGTVVLAPYVDASKREPVFTFKADAQSIMYPEVEDENDFVETCNVVRMYSEDEFGNYWAVASNVDGDSPSSLPNRGNRERTMYEEETELKPVYDPEGAIANEITKGNQRAEALAQIAKQKLIDNSAEIEYVTIGNGMYPIHQGDSIAIEYADRTWQGIVTNIKRNKDVSAKCTTKVRRYVTHDLKVEVRSGWSR